MSAPIQNFRALPGAYWDLQGRLHSIRCIALSIPVIETEEASAEYLADQIDMANHLVAALEDLVTIALKDAALMERQLSGGDAVVRSGVRSASESASAAAMPLWQNLHPT